MKNPNLHTAGIIIVNGCFTVNPFRIYETSLFFTITFEFIFFGCTDVAYGQLPDSVGPPAYRNFESER